MGIYSSFLCSKHLAISYFANIKDNDYLHPFWVKFNHFCDKNNIAIEVEKHPKYIKISAGSFVIHMELTDNGEVDRIKVHGMGYLTKMMRDSIWQTKTFYDLPVLMVFNTSFDDETYWEDFPRDFTISLFTQDRLKQITEPIQDF